ncbi:MAG: LysE family translocator [Ferrovibrio sp.]|uniref:LysE family translocator n=1 Tax=Ferrovibrio sp. TaxID=1917215 RepID=UPI0026076DDB|nr:LysE family translocator [Ferrovibrio sp.]MCW0236176.1 LysE family translocator [Ferrovibrio sp.]
MTPEQFVGQTAAFFVFSLVAAITPGPSNVLLVATGAQAGFLRGLPCLFGVSAGMGSMMFLAAYGFGSIVLAQPQILLGIRLLGAGFLLWLAWKIASAPVGDGGNAATPRPAGFLGAAALQWVNPKAWLVSAGAVATYLPGGDSDAVLQAAGFALVFVAAALPSGLVWLVFGAAAQRLLRSPGRQRAFNIVTGLMLAASVVMILR